MKRIWKFPLQIADDQRIEMPVGAEPLYVTIQRTLDPICGGLPLASSVVLYAMVDTERAKETQSRRVCLRGTGHPCDGLEAFKPLGVVDVFGDGRLMLHVFW